MNIGILGAGNIASTMAKTLRQMPEVTSWAVASRTWQKAQDFASQYGFSRAYGSYEELVSDPAVDLIYIATPHSHHYEHMKLCIQHGKNMLTEKAFTQNAHQAKEVLAMAKEKGVLVAEAIWTRYMPMRERLNAILKSGIIGTPYSLYATLCYPIMHVKRIVEPSLAGGALLDLGIYPLNFVSMLWGDAIEKIEATAVLTDKGVDAADSITLCYPDGKMAMVHCDARTACHREGAIYGDRGYILVQNINNCEKICVYDTNHQLIQSELAPPQITGYEYEVRACIDALEKGEKECIQMPHAQMIKMMELMDQIRQKTGVVYPNEH